ncbi:MAG: DEAD/DEAH box helicase [Alphaproteobacteria bacterium]
MKNFKEAGIPAVLSAQLEKIGFKEPTPIQAEAIPPALEGKDILGSAQTGTGKTAAYGIPLLTKLINDKNSAALVLLPTRELAMQVMQTLKTYLDSRNQIISALLIGGDPISKQMRQLKAHPRLIVGTPGRINDHLERRTLNLKRTNFLVLDEVDRMLDMGFEVQLNAISKYLTSKRQTLMFSATLPKSIEKMAGKYLHEPIRISMGASHSPAENVDQVHIKLSETEKYPRLLEELENRSGSIIMFMKTKRSVDKMASKLKKEGHESDAIHGDLRQSKRTRVINDFRKQKSRILVATDVAARGLDIPHIEHVINYDLPQCPEDYIHRIGRTARAGAKGNALNLISPKDKKNWNQILRLLNPNDKHEDLPKAKKKNRNGRNRSRHRHRN